MFSYYISSQSHPTNCKIAFPYCIAHKEQKEEAIKGYVWLRKKLITCLYRVPVLMLLSKKYSKGFDNGKYFPLAQHISDYAGLRACRRGGDVARNCVRVCVWLYVCGCMC